MMRIPGANLLNLALSVINPAQIQWFKFLKQTVGANLAVANTYAPPVTIRGSAQPVPRQLMETLGLDFNKSYIHIYAPNNLIDLERDISSDQFRVNRVLYQGISATPWFSYDGWNEILAVAVPPSSTTTTGCC